MKGKKYEKGKLIFDGELKDGYEWTGKIKKYNYDGNLEFEGEYLYGKNHGYGKNKEGVHGKLKFEGEYYYGKKWKGKFYDYDYSTVELEEEYEYLYGEKNGKVIAYFKGGKIRFEGEYLKDEKWNGKGYNPNGELVYEIKNGKATGLEYNFEWKLKNNKDEDYD